MVNPGAPSAMIHAPAWSQLPMCGSGSTAPRPEARAANIRSMPSTQRVSRTIRSAPITGSRNTSNQYLA